jgi:hypothetical protein
MLSQELRECQEVQCSTSVSVTRVINQQVPSYYEPDEQRCTNDEPQNAQAPFKPNLAYCQFLVYDSFLKGDQSTILLGAAQRRSSVGFCLL